MPRPPSRRFRQVPPTPPPPTPSVSLSRPLPPPPPPLTTDSEMMVMGTAGVHCTSRPGLGGAVGGGQRDGLSPSLRPVSEPITATVPAADACGQGWGALHFPRASVGEAMGPEGRSRAPAALAEAARRRATAGAQPPLLPPPRRAFRPRGCAKPSTPFRCRPFAMARCSPGNPEGQRIVTRKAVTAEVPVASSSPPPLLLPCVEFPRTRGTTRVMATQDAEGVGVGDPRPPPRDLAPCPDVTLSTASSRSLESFEPKPSPLQPPRQPCTWSPRPVAMGRTSSEAGGGGGSGDGAGDPGQWWDIWAAAAPWGVADRATEAALHDAGTFLDNVLENLGGSPAV